MLDANILIIRDYFSQLNNEIQQDIINNLILNNYSLIKTINFEIDYDEEQWNIQSIFNIYKSLSEAQKLTVLKELLILYKNKEELKK